MINLIGFILFLGVWSIPAVLVATLGDNTLFLDCSNIRR